MKRRTFLSAALAALSTPFGLWKLQRRPKLPETTLLPGERPLPRGSAAIYGEDGELVEMFLASGNPDGPMAHMELWATAEFLAMPVEDRRKVYKRAWHSEFGVVEVSVIDENGHVTSKETWQGGRRLA